MPAMHCSSDVSVHGRELTREMEDIPRDVQCHHHQESAEVWLELDADCNPNWE